VAGEAAAGCAGRRSCGRTNIEEAGTTELPLTCPLSLPSLGEAHTAQVQHSTAQHSTLQYSTVPYSKVQYTTLQYCTVRV